MNAASAESTDRRSAEYLIELILKAVPLAMGIAVSVTAVLGELEVTHGLSMLGIGLACLAIRELKQ